MSLGAGIGVFGIWIATAAIVAIFNTRLGDMKQGINPVATLALVGIACLATYYVSVAR